MPKTAMKAMTDEMAMLELARQALIAAVTAGQRSKDVAGLMTTVASREGVCDALGEFVAVLSRKGYDVLAVNRVAVRLLARDPDDRWSGRTNDITRSYNDGVRQVAERVLGNTMLYVEPDTDLSDMRFF